MKLSIASFAALAATSVSSFAAITTLSPAVEDKEPLLSGIQTHNQSPSRAFGTQYWNNIDNATTFQGISTASSPTTGLGNLQMGMAVFLSNFTAGTSQIRFLEVPIGNLTGAAITARPVRVNVWIWETVNTANIATGSTTPVFAQVKDLGGGPTAPTATFNFSSFTLANSSISLGILDFGTPFTLSPTNATQDLIGVSFNVQVDNGAGFVSVPNLNTTIIGGATQAAPLVGTSLFGPPPTGGYFRSANSTVDVNGQFAGGSTRTVGNNSGVPFALYIPEPATFTVLAGVGLIALRRRK
jgi:hypothetical protein